MKWSKGLTLAEYRNKPQQMVESRTDIQTETKQDKLRFSKTLLGLQLENTAMVEKKERGECSP